MQKAEISLSPRATSTINEILSCGNRVQVDFNPRTKELAIYEVPRLKTKYRVIVASGRQ